MTKNEINFSLALAIGYPTGRVRNVHGFVQVYNALGRNDGPIQYNGWQSFDYTRPAVIWPIAEKFDAFPMRFPDGTWFTSIPGGGETNYPPPKVAATASALAVIWYMKGKK